MKKIFTLVFVLMAVPVFASNYITLCESDTIRISPTHLGNYVLLPVIANFDGVADHWRLELTHPNVMGIISSGYSNSYNDPNNGMHVPYINSDGNEDIYAALLTVIYDEQPVGNYAKFSVLESTITQLGYWDPDNDGVYESYGTVKWGPGHYDKMFDIHFSLDSDCSGDSLVVSWLITSSYDLRYPTSTINYDLGSQVIYISIRYLKGDVNGDEQVNIYDVTALTDLLNGQLQTLDQYQFDAADVNSDGEVNVADVTRLVDVLLGFGTLDLEPGDME